jgi:hypothetical protein
MRNSQGNKQLERISIMNRTLISETERHKTLIENFLEIRKNYARVPVNIRPLIAHYSQFENENYPNQPNNDYLFQIPADEE